MDFASYSIYGEGVHGSVIATWIAIKRPDKVSSLLIASPGFMSECVPLSPLYLPASLPPSLSPSLSPSLPLSLPPSLPPSLSLPPFSFPPASLLTTFADASSRARPQTASRRRHAARRARRLDGEQERPRRRLGHVPARRARGHLRVLYRWEREAEGGEGAHEGALPGAVRAGRGGERARCFLALPRGACSFPLSFLCRGLRRASS